MISGIGNIPRITGLELGVPAAQTAPIGADAFSTMVSQAALNTVQRLEAAESLSLKALQGEAETREVVDAVMDAEQSLQAAIAIRDKIVSAYLEISRMAI
jgi:flagellar hook-basal body complex protein FliE